MKKSIPKTESKVRNGPHEHEILENLEEKVETQPQPLRRSAWKKKGNK